MKNNKLLFYVLSFTWGLPMTLVGMVAAAVMLLLFRKPELCGYCIRFRIGNGWGGVAWTNDNYRQPVRERDYIPRTRSRNSKHALRFLYAGSRMYSLDDTILA